MTSCSNETRGSAREWDFRADNGAFENSISSASCIPYDRVSGDRLDHEVNEGNAKWIPNRFTGASDT